MVEAATDWNNYLVKSGLNPKLIQESPKGCDSLSSVKLDERIYFETGPIWLDLGIQGLWTHNQKNLAR